MGATASSAPFAATHPPLPPSLDLLAVFNSDDDDDDDESFFQTIEIEDLDEAPTTVTADPTKPVKLSLLDLGIAALAQAPFLETLLPPLLPNLAYLDLSSNDLTLIDLQPLLLICNNLRALNMSSNPRLFEGTDPIPVLACSGLILLDVSFVTVTDETRLSALLNNFPALLSLSLESCGLESLKGLSSTNANLLHLVLSDNEILTADAIDLCPSLTTLDLRENDIASIPNYRNTILAALPNLASLDGQFVAAVAAKTEAEVDGAFARIQAGGALTDETSALISEKEFDAAVTGKVDSTAVA